MKTKIINVSFAIQKKHVCTAIRHNQITTALSVMQRDIGTQHHRQEYANARQVTMSSMKIAYYVR